MNAMEGYLVDNTGKSKAGFGSPIPSDIGDAPLELLEDPPLIAADDDDRDGENSIAKYPMLSSPDRALTLCDTDPKQVDWDRLIYEPHKYAEQACIFKRSAEGSSGQISEVTATEGTKVNQTPNSNLRGDGDVGKGNMQKHSFIKDANAEQAEHDTAIYAPQKYAELVCIFKRSAEGSSGQISEVTATEGTNVNQTPNSNLRGDGDVGKGNMQKHSFIKDANAEQAEHDTAICAPQKYAELACIFKRSAEGSSGQISEVLAKEGTNVNQTPNSNFHGDGDGKR